MGRIGWPGRGPPPLRCPLPGVVPGTGPRLPVGSGREGTLGRVAGAPDDAAAGRTEGGWAPAGAAGRDPAGTVGLAAAEPAAGGPVGAGGRIGIAAGTFVAGAGGAIGFATGGAATGVAATDTGVPEAPGIGVLGTPGTVVCAVDAGATGACIGTAGLTTGAVGDAIGAATGAAGFAATPGAAATGGGGVTGRIRAALAAASFASFSALAAASALASASAWPKMFLRTFSATSSGMELECVFFSVTPYPGKRSMIALALTSSSRANSLILTWFASFMRPMDRSTVKITGLVPAEAIS
jgi:hypothetical protein